MDTTYGENFGSKDIVKCEVDSDKGTIEFFKNGESQGIAFENVRGLLRPAVCCGKSCVVCELLSVVKL